MGFLDLMIPYAYIKYLALDNDVDYVRYMNFITVTQNLRRLFCGTLTARLTRANILTDVSVLTQNS